MQLFQPTERMTTLDPTQCINLEPSACRDASITASRGILLPLATPTARSAPLSRVVGLSWSTDKSRALSLGHPASVPQGAQAQLEVGYH